MFSVLFPSTPFSDLFIRVKVTNSLLSDALQLLVSQTNQALAPLETHFYIQLFKSLASFKA